jgi:hypothetical protein
MAEKILPQEVSLAHWANDLSRFQNDPDWQRLWLEVRSAEWRSVAVLPADPSVSSLALVHGLVTVGYQHLQSPLIVADLRNLPLPLIERAKSEIRRRVSQGDTVVMALSNSSDNPSSLALARAADTVVVGVLLESTPLGRVREVIRQVGKKRLLGAVALRPLEANAH